MFVVHVVRYSGICVAYRASPYLGFMNYVALFVSGYNVYM